MLHKSHLGSISFLPIQMGLELIYMGLKLTCMGLNLLKQVPTIINWQGISRPKNKEGKISIKIRKCDFCDKTYIGEDGFL